MIVVFRKFGFRCWLTSAFFLVNLAMPEATSAQVIPDGTTLTPDPGSCLATCTIMGGTADSTGTNLFHSFLQFSVPEGGTVFFEHDPTVRNIFTRVTGNDLSDINGLIRTDNISNASLFLINPNGIIFGPSGGLDLGGSFVATTADAIQFGAQGSFSALDTTTNPALLTVAPSAFLFSQAEVAPIFNQSDAFTPASFSPGLAVRENRSLLLVGGDILSGPSPTNEFGGNITAPSGRIELGGLNGPGVIDLDISDNKLNLTYGDEASLANVSVNSVTLDVSDFFNGTAAGEIVIKADSLSSSNSFINSQTFGTEDAGGILLHADSSINLQSTFILSNTNALTPGTGGTLEISTSSLSLDNFSAILFGTFGTGNAGEILIEAETVSILGGSSITSDSTSTLEPAGDAGQIQIRTDSLLLDDISFISTRTSGDALDVDASGNLVVEAQDSILITGGSFIASETSGQRNASSITLTTPQLAVQDLASISATTSGAGTGGTIQIFAPETVILTDESFIAASSTSSGAAGNIAIQTNGQFRVEDGAQVEVSGEGTGNSGMLDVIAETVVLDDGQLLASVQAGEDGNIELDIEDALVLRGDSRISAEAFADANGGNVDITTPFIIALLPDGPNGSDIQASAINGDGGRITIQANTLFGIEENKAIEGNMTNDIDASSGSGIDGEVIIQTLEVDPDSGTVSLPSGLADTEISRGCQAGSNGQFIATGQGGLPSNPYEPLSSDGIQDDIYPAGQIAAQQTVQTAPNQTEEASTETLVEAQAWGRNTQGNIVLMAASPTPHGSCQQTLTGAF